jgi:hypothetical protein
MYLYDNSSTQRCPIEIMKIFLIEDFPHILLHLLTFVQNGPSYSTKKQQQRHSINRENIDTWESQSKNHMLLSI